MAVLLLGIAALLLLWLPAAAAAAAPVEVVAAAEDDGPTLVLYWGEGCSNCEAERDFLAELQADEPELRIETVEVFKDDEGRSRFARHAERLGIDTTAVPTTVLDQRVWIGFTPGIAEDITATVTAALAGRPVPTGVYGQPGEGTCQTSACEIEPEGSVDVPLIGQVELGDHSLVLSTLAIGFVDGINPCSLWAISILLAIVIRTGSRRRVLAIGSTFLVVTAGMYALFMAGIYGALSVVEHLGAIQLAVALAAGVFGVVSVKDYFLYKQGLSFTIPDRAKPGLYARMRAVAGTRALIPALAATVALAIGVSLLETPCTAGFPVLWTGMLEANDVQRAGVVLLFLVYMIPFLIDEFAVFLVAVVTMRATKLQERHGRLLKLVAGTTMLALAATMLLAPEVMESMWGAAIVFLAAGGVAAVIHLLARRTHIGTRSGVKSKTGHAPSS
jgi:thiol-disulfide isomerase/thioredoxin